MKQNMIKHFLNLHKNGGRLSKFVISESEVILCDGYFFFIQDRNKMVLNENIFLDLKEDIFTKMIHGKDYVDGKIACYLPTHRRNKFNILIKNTNEDRIDNRVIVNGEMLDLFNYSRLEIKGQTEVVKLFNEKGKLLGGLLPIRCSAESYAI